MSKITSFDALPTEIAWVTASLHLILYGLILIHHDRSFTCSFLCQADISKLSLARKSIYQLVRPILYRHPSITTFSSLVLFSRTISNATYMGKADRYWSNQDCLDQTEFLDLTIDPTKNDGQPAPAVLISRTIQAIVRRCPNLALTLCFSHCQCGQSPVSALGTETFPRVIKLVVYVGKHDPDDTHSHVRETRNCFPNAKFWRPFVNGEVLPDCSDLEVRHHWATTPPVNASLDLQKRYQDSANVFATSAPQGRASRFGVRRGLINRMATQEMYLPSTELIGSTSGLKKFRSIILECPPELNSLLLMQLLGNPSAVASNLTSLELRFCNLDYETISNLIYHAPPNVKRLVLLCSDIRDDGFHALHEVVHLCPLIREVSKNLVHLEFGASTVCRELFFDDLDRQALRNNAVETGLGIDGGAVDKHLGELDGYAVRETIQACRKRKRTNFRNDRVKEAISAATSRTSTETSSTSLFGGNSMSNTNQAATRAQRETEASLGKRSFGVMPPKVK